MKSYLILMFGKGVDRASINENSKFDQYRKWGQYLSQFGEDDKFISGSPLNKQVHTISKCSSEELNKNPVLEGYMIIESENLEEVESRLCGNPILDTTGAFIQVYEMNPQGLMSAWDLKN